MQNILSTLLFSIAPQMVDVLISSTYLAQALEPAIAIIMFLTVASYMPITVIITEWRGKLRRELNRTDQVRLCVHRLGALVCTLCDFCPRPRRVYVVAAGRRVLGDAQEV